MRTCFNKVLLAFLYGIGVFLVSCEDDEKSTGESLGFGTEQIEIDRLGGSCSVDIQVNEGLHWTLSLPDENEWLTVTSEMEGTGSASVELYVEDNATNEVRTQNLTLTLDDGTTWQIPVRQTTLLAGETEPDNDDVEFMDVFNNKGIGRGYDIVNRRAKQPIIQMTGLKTLVAEEGPYEWAGLYQETPIAASDVEVVSYDSIDNKLDSLSAKLSIGVSFGLFKLNINGEYASSEKVGDATVTYRMGCRYPVYHATLNYVDLMAYFDAEEDKAVKNRMLSIGFQNCRNKIVSLAANESEADNLNRALADLDSKYGPMVVTETTLGGEMTMKLDADSTFIKDNMTISGGASVAIQAVISIEGNASAAYVRAGEMLLDNSNLSLTMNGGQTAKGQAMAEYLTSSINITRGGVNALATEWANSIVMDGTNKRNNTAEVIEMTFVPIWSFFDGVAADVVRDYMVKKYKDNPDCIVDLSDY